MMAMGLAESFGGGKERAAIDDVIVRPNIDKLFRELSRLLLFGARGAPLPKQGGCPQQSEHRSDRVKLTPCYRTL